MEISSRIDGEFTGTNDEVIFKLQNGQIWQQVGYRYRYMYRYAPLVTIEAIGTTGIRSPDAPSNRPRRRLAPSLR